MPARKITIGYEQSRPDAVLAALKKARLQSLADTRAVAASRKPGFSKHRLAAALDQVGIAHLHLQKLRRRIPLPLQPHSGIVHARAGAAVHDPMPAL